MRLPDAVTYHLGHNEQMQLAICISTIAEVLREAQAAFPEGVPDDNAWMAAAMVALRDSGLGNLNLETLALFEGIFGTGGTMSLTKNFEDPEAEYPLSPPGSGIEGLATDVLNLPRFRDRFTEEEWAQRQAETAAAVEDEHSHGGTPTLDDGC